MASPDPLRIAKDLVAEVEKVQRTVQSLSVVMLTLVQQHADRINPIVNQTITLLTDSWTAEEQRHATARRQFANIARLVEGIAFNADTPTVGAHSYHVYTQLTLKLPERETTVAAQTPTPSASRKRLLSSLHDRCDSEAPQSAQYSPSRRSKMLKTTHEDCVLSDDEYVTACSSSFSLVV